MLKGALSHVTAWHDEAASLMLVLLGGLLLAAGLWIDRTQAVNITLLVLGAGLVAVGAFLPRIQGNLTIGAGGVGIPVAAPNPLGDALLRLEAVRESAEQAAEAESTDPDEKREQVEEKVGQAWFELFPTSASVTASVAGSAIPPNQGWPVPTYYPIAPTYHGGAALPPQPFSDVRPDEYVQFLKRLQEPPDEFANRIVGGPPQSGK